MNLWEKFISENPEIQKKLNHLPQIDPMAEVVDAALEAWMSKKRDIPFSLTSERRALLIKIIRLTIKYESIWDSPFYQYIRAYELYLYYWLLELQKQEVIQGSQTTIHYLEIFDDIIFEAFKLGYALRTVKPPKKGS